MTFAAVLRLPKPLLLLLYSSESFVLCVTTTVKASLQRQMNKKHFETTSQFCPITSPAVMIVAASCAPRIIKQQARRTCLWLLSVLTCEEARLRCCEGAVEEAEGAACLAAVRIHVRTSGNT